MTIEMLEKKLAKMQKEREKAVASMNAIAGAIQVLQELIDEAKGVDHKPIEAEVVNP